MRFFLLRCLRWTRGLIDDLFTRVEIRLIPPFDPKTFPRSDISDEDWEDFRLTVFGERNPLSAHQYNALCIHGPGSPDRCGHPDCTGARWLRAHITDA